MLAIAKRTMPEIAKRIAIMMCGAIRSFKNKRDKIATAAGMPAITIPADKEDVSLTPINMNIENRTLPMNAINASKVNDVRSRGFSPGAFRNQLAMNGIAIR